MSAEAQSSLGLHCPTGDPFSPPPRSRLPPGVRNKGGGRLGLATLQREGRSVPFPNFPRPGARGSLVHTAVFSGELGLYQAWLLVLRPRVNTQPGEAPGSKEKAGGLHRDMIQEGCLEEVPRQLGPEQAGKARGSEQAQGSRGVKNSLRGNESPGLASGRRDWQGGTESLAGWADTGPWRPRGGRGAGLPCLCPRGLCFVVVWFGLVAVARAGQSQNPGTSAGSPTWMPKHLSHLLPPKCTGRKWAPKLCSWHSQQDSAGLTHCATQHLALLSGPLAAGPSLGQCPPHPHAKGGRTVGAGRLSHGVLAIRLRFQGLKAPQPPRGGRHTQRPHSPSARLRVSPGRGEVRRGREVGKPREGRTLAQGHRVRAQDQGQPAALAGGWAGVGRRAGLWRWPLEC